MSLGEENLCENGLLRLYDSMILSEKVKAKSCLTTKLKENNPSYSGKGETGVGEGVGRRKTKHANIHQGK